MDGGLCRSETVVSHTYLYVTSVYVSRACGRGCDGSFYHATTPHPSITMVHLFTVWRPFGREIMHAINGSKFLVLMCSLGLVVKAVDLVRVDALLVSRGLCASRAVRYLASPFPLATSAHTLRRLPLPMCRLPKLPSPQGR